MFKLVEKVECQKCGRSWEKPCDQTRCIERFGECIVCRFVPRGQQNPHGSGSGTDEEFSALSPNV